MRSAAARAEPGEATQTHIKSFTELQRPLMREFSNMNSAPKSPFALAIYLHGEQLIPIFIGALLFTIALLAAVSWLTVRYFKPRIGRMAYLLASLPFLLACIALFFEFQREKPNSGPPNVIKADKLSGLIRRLPAQAKFSLSGISFFNSKLFVGTNLGIIEISGGKPVEVYQFQSSDSVVSGPWLDKADNRLWAVDDHTGELLCFDGKVWTRMAKPLPSKGYYSRGDVLEGIQLVGNANGFWMASAGGAWKWDSTSNRWLLIAGNLAQPEDYKRVNEIIGVLPVGNTVLLIIRHEPLPFLVRPGEEFLSDEVVAASSPTSLGISRVGEPFLSDAWTVTQDAGYICSKDQRLFQITAQSVGQLSAPGPCESLSVDDDSNLLVSVRRKGVFRYATGKWILVAASPYPSGEGEYWTHLSASSTQLAIAVDGKPVVDKEHSSGSQLRFIQNAPTSLWVFKDGSFSPVGF